MGQEVSEEKTISEMNSSSIEEIKASIEALKVAITRLSSRVKELESTLSNVAAEIGKTVGDAVIGAVREATKELRETSERLLKSSEEITKATIDMNKKLTQSIDEIAKKDTLNRFMEEVRQFANMKVMELILGLNAIRGSSSQLSSESKETTPSVAPARRPTAPRQTSRKGERKKRDEEEEEGLIRPSQLFRR